MWALRTCCCVCFHCCSCWILLEWTPFPGLHTLLLSSLILNKYFLYHSGPSKQNSQNEYIWIIYVWFIYRWCVCVPYMLWTSLSNNGCLQIEVWESNSCSVHDASCLSWSSGHVGILKKYALIPVKKCLSSRIYELFFEREGKQAEGNIFFLPFLLYRLPMNCGSDLSWVLGTQVI